MARRKMHDGDEYDAYTPWRKYIARFQRAGEVKKIKRRTHKRERREGKNFDGLGD